MKGENWKGSLKEHSVDEIEDLSMKPKQPLNSSSRQYWFWWEKGLIHVFKAAMTIQSAIAEVSF